jgi:hypothetical protein
MEAWDSCDSDSNGCVISYEQNCSCESPTIPENLNTYCDAYKAVPKGLFRQVPERRCVSPECRGSPRVLYMILSSFSGVTVSP